MRCEYCSYHNRYDPKYVAKDMSLEVAYKAIEMFLKRSKKLSSVVISFYGGEPLVKLEFIKKCVEFSKQRSRGQHILYHITTNGTLLDTETIDYLKENNFLICVSLDGPRELHDRYRIFKNRQPTYDIIINNLKLIRYKYPEYFYGNLIILSVYAKPYKDDILYDYFEKFPVEYVLNDLFITPYFKTILNKASKEETRLTIKEKITYPKFKRKHDNDLYKYRNIDKPVAEIKKTFPAGSCIPACKKIYVNSKGKIFLCERINEDEKNCVGDVWSDISIDSIYDQCTKLLNTFKKNNCKSCWAIHFCHFCFREIDDINEGKCARVKNRVRNEMISSIEHRYCETKD